MKEILIITKYQLTIAILASLTLASCYFYGTTNKNFYCGLAKISGAMGAIIYVGNFWSTTEIKIITIIF